MRDPVAVSPLVRQTNGYPHQPNVPLRTESPNSPEGAPVNEFGGHVVAFYCIFRLGTIHEYLTNHGINIHYNYIFLPVLVLLVLVGGRILRIVRTPTGKWLTSYVVWMIATVPTSFWRGGSFGAVQNYVLDSFLFFLAVASFFVSIKRCERFMLVAALAMVCFVVVAQSSGIASRTGRFVVLGGKFGNPNDLALHLVFLAPLAICFIRTKKESIVSMVILVGTIFALMVGTVIFFQTGSRGGLLALTVVLVLWFARLPPLKKIPMLLVFAMMIFVASVLLPTATMGRYATIFSDKVEVDAADALSVESAESSSVARKNELWSSIQTTFTHPIFGVGVEQYRNYMGAEAYSQGKRRADIATHNAYTQASSELGIVGVILFVGAMVSTWRSLKRTREAIRGIPELRSIDRMAQGVGFSLVAFCVGSAFSSLAYAIYLPLVAALAIGLSMSVEGVGALPVAAEPDPFGPKVTIPSPRRSWDVR